MRTRSAGRAGHGNTHCQRRRSLQSAHPVPLGRERSPVLVRALPSDIAAFLDAKPGLDNVTVALQPPYEMTVETQLAVAGFALPRFARSKVRGRLVVSGGTLIMEVADLRIAGYPTGTIPAIVLETLINPLVDLSALPASSRVTSVQVTPDAVLLTASGSQTSIAFERGAR